MGNPLEMQSDKESCPHCLGEYNQGASFCKECGHPIEHVEFNKFVRAAFLAFPLGLLQFLVVLFVAYFIYELIFVFAGVSDLLYDVVVYVWIFGALFYGSAWLFGFFAHLAVYSHWSDNRIFSAVARKHVRMRSFQDNIGHNLVVIAMFFAITNPSTHEFQSRLKDQVSFHKYERRDFVVASVFCRVPEFGSGSAPRYFVGMLSQFFSEAETSWEPRLKLVCAEN